LAETILDGRQPRYSDPGAPCNLSATESSGRRGRLELIEGHSSRDGAEAFGFGLEGFPNSVPFFWPQRYVAEFVGADLETTNTGQARKPALRNCQREAMRSKVVHN
jgi:hypothetical protein